MPAMLSLGHSGGCFSRGSHMRSPHVRRCVRHRAAAAGKREPKSPDVQAATILNLGRGLLFVLNVVEVLKSVS